MRIGLAGIDDQVEVAILLGIGQAVTIGVDDRRNLGVAERELVRARALDVARTVARHREVRRHRGVEPGEKEADLPVGVRRPRAYVEPGTERIALLAGVDLVAAARDR